MIRMQGFEKLGVFYLGRLYDIKKGSPLKELLLYDSKDLVTHAVCIGMTGSGKTGLCISLIEEAAIDNVPAILIDPKGDVTNLLLTFPRLQGQDFLPWINEEDARKKGLSPEEFAEQQAALWREGLQKWGQDGNRIQRLRDSAEFLIYTPGSNAGLQISILKSFATPPIEIIQDEELLQERINTTVTSLLSLLGIEADPIKSREHILISNILAQCWRQGEDLDLGRLIQLIQSPPLKRIGVLDLESFYPSKDRFELALRLNNLLAAPGFSLWLEGDPLDVGQLLYSPSGKPRISIFYIAHLNDAQRMFFVSLLLNQIVGWMRTQSGTTSLRAILYIDEVFGYLPPVANPPSKLPLITLLKQARAFGLGVVLATQNPIDLDYKALSNAGTWFLGRLQTERDKERVLDGLEGVALASQKGFSRQYFDRVLSGLGKRIFLMNNVHEDAPAVFETRWAMSYLRGPLTREQIKMLVEPMKRQQKLLISPQTTSKLSPAVASPAPSALTMTSKKPIIPPGIREYYMPYKKDIGKQISMIYQPMLIGAAQIQYSVPKEGIYTTVEKVFITPVSDKPIPVNWDEAKEVDVKVPDLLEEPPEDLPYTDLPPAATNAKNYAYWEKDFSNWLLRTQKLQLFRSPSLNELSQFGETERDFRIRLQQIAREKRDQQVEKLRQKYASALARLDERIRRAKMVLEEQQAQAKSREYEAAVSIGETILGSFLGRKSSTRATRATREISRTMKEKRDKEKAEENLKALQQEREKLEAQFQSEINTIETKINPLTETFETVWYTATKTGINIQLVALVWVPSNIN
ncbi:MAG: ATP-binding protein [Thermoproteota archaeon]